MSYDPATCGLQATRTGRLQRQGYAPRFLGEMRQQCIDEQDDPEHLQHFLKCIENAIINSVSAVQVGFPGAEHFNSDGAGQKHRSSHDEA